jgi:hypothetical protein
MSSEIPAGFRRPFRVDEMDCFICPSHEASVTSRSPPPSCCWRPRIQYLSDGQDQMDAWEAWFNERARGCGTLAEVVIRLNEEDGA